MSLARFTKAAPARNEPAPERCDLCAHLVPAEHGHIADTRDRRILCACRPCYLLFTPEGASQGHFKSIGVRYARLHDFELSAEQWDDLQLPIDLAFFFYSTPASKIVAFYPSPAGAMESALKLDAWHDIAQAAPALREMESDVEALLVNRARGGDQRAYIVPIDVCYELVGLIRATWKGFDGGDESRRRLNEFFSGIDDRCAERAAGSARS